MNFKLGYTYLVKAYDVLSSVTILRISAKAYHVRWNIDKPSTQWILNDEFEKKYEIIEDISGLMRELPFDLPNISDTQLKINFPEFNLYDYRQYPPVPLSTTEYELCPFCNGTGQVFDYQSTAGFRTCPTCNGTGQIVKKVTVHQ